MIQLVPSEFVCTREIPGAYGARIWVNKNSNPKIIQFLSLVSPWQQSDKQDMGNLGFEMPFGLGQQVSDILVKRFFMTEHQF
jgi:hypothetical protein